MILHNKPKEKREQPSGEASRDRVAAGIVQKCLGLQLKWALFMERKTRGLSYSRMKYCLLIFCLLPLGCSLYLARNSFRDGAKKSLSVTAIKIPQHSTNTGEEQTHGLLTLTKVEFERIERFRRYMDSLAQTEKGRRIKNAILLSRPGLMDSIKALEKLYQLKSRKN